MVLAEDQVHKDENGISAGGEASEDEEAAHDSSLLRWICTELHGKSMPGNSIR